MKPAREGIISEILIELEDHQPKSAVFAKLSAKRRIASRTFDTYWSIAGERYRESEQRLQLALEAKRIDEREKEYAKSLKSKNAHLAQLEEMLLPDYMHTETIWTKEGAESYQRSLNPSEITKIKDLIGKWQGYPAPTKLAVTDVEGKDVVRIGGKEVDPE